MPRPKFNCGEKLKIVQNGETKTTNKNIRSDTLPSEFGRQSHRQKALERERVVGEEVPVVEVVVKCEGFGGIVVDLAGGGSAGCHVGGVAV